MWQLLATFLIIGMAIVAIKLAIGLLLIAGLILKPKETLSLIVVFGAFALLRNYPAASYTVLGVGAVVALARLYRNDGAAP